MKRLAIFIAITCIVLSVNSVYSQTFDSTFGKNGMVKMPPYSGVEFLDFDSQGNIVALGVSIGGPAILKTDANGIIDSSFGENGLLILYDYNSNWGKRLGLKITDENKILVVLFVYSHGFLGEDDPPKYVMLRFNEDGSFDENFGTNGEIILNDGITTVNTENDDYMLIASIEVYYDDNNNHNQDPYISKYNYNGELDTNFGVNGKAYLTDKKAFQIFPNSIKILNDQSIVAVGYDAFNAFAKLAFCKLSQQGNLVTNFANNGVYINACNTNYNKSFKNITVGNNGKLVLIGMLIEWISETIFYRSFICSFNSNGTSDNSFGVNGFFYYDNYIPNYDQAILQNGNNYLTGHYKKIVSINSNGTVDTDFGNGGSFVFDSLIIKDMIFQGEDKIIVIGRDGLVRLNISQIPQPLKANAGENQHFCFGDGDLKQAELGGNPTALGGMPPYTYRWWTNKGSYQFVSDTTEANPSIIFHTGTITVYLEVTDSIKNVAIDSAVISMSDLPYSFLDNPYYLPIEHYILQGDSVWITIDTIVNVIGNSTCRWEPTTGLNNSTVCSGFWAKPNVTTTYSLIVTDEYGCSEKVWLPIHKIYVDEVGIVETDNYPSLPQIFPNPTTGQLRITNYELRDNANIQIFDVVGCNVGTYRIRPENDEIMINISHLADGMYFLKIDGKVFKVVKQ